MLPLALIACADSAFAAPQTTVIDFARDGAALSIETQAATAKIVSEGDGAALMMEAAAAGEDAPTVVLTPKQRSWDFSKYCFLVVNVANSGTAACDFVWSVEDANSKDWRSWMQRRWRLQPGEARLFEVDLPAKAGRDAQGNPIEVFGMRTTPYGPPFEADKRSIDTSRVVRMRFTTPNASPGRAFTISNVYALGSTTLTPPDGAPFFPFIDKYGQHMHEDWPDKVHADADLARLREAEAQDLATHSRPADWDKWGGWKDGPALKATGHFRVEKHEGKWWLVDPDGRLFFSNGVAAVRSGAEMSAGTVTPITDRERYFSGLPAQDDPLLGRFYARVASGLDHYRNQRVTPLCFNFAGANILRKYGKDFESVTPDLAQRRVASWGYNTLGNWSDLGLCMMGRTPYTCSVTTFYVGRKLSAITKYGKPPFPDVFDPAFEPAVRARVAELKATADDPWCIGYFVDNEMPWDAHRVELTTCESPSTQPAKLRLLELLKARHKDVAALNKAWGADYASWDDFMARRAAPDRAKAAVDFDAFLEVFADRYFSVVRAAIKAMAPNKLYLGCRFNTHNKPPAVAAARHCDVVSYNLYYFPEDVRRFKGESETDTPLLIGEWHFGTLDHGMFDYGMRLVRDQAERAAYYREYMKAALANPQFVGAHWFRYNNHPTTGRASDGANAHNGLVDICDTPYRETIAAARDMGRELYRLRVGGKRGGER